MRELQLVAFSFFFLSWYHNLSKMMRIHVQSVVRFSSFSVADVRAVPIGKLGTQGFRIFFDHSGTRISPWHSIPLRSKHAFHYVNEIPKGTTEKLEISTSEEYNPIKQDEKKGVLRCFRYRGGLMPFNYGALPQTWEDPTKIDERTRCKGDGDPVDVVELSREPLSRGAICEVKPLGILAMIDEGETDWKVLCIRSDHPLAPHMQCMKDVEKTCPGLVENILDWFRMYKTAEGKGENSFALGGGVLDADLARHVIAETHEQWKAKYGNR